MLKTSTTQAPSTSKQEADLNPDFMSSEYNSSSFQYTLHLDPTEVARMEEQVAR